MINIAIKWEKADYSVRTGFFMKPHKILKNIDISIPEGSVLGLVGPNGAGKTTTIKLGAGLLKPESGKVFIKGLPAIRTDVKNSIGLLTESQYIYPHLKLKEWLRMLAGLSRLSKQTLTEKTDQILERLHLSELSDKMMLTLSKGQLQRAGLAQALIHDPEILLLDEPMSGLDPYWRHRVQQILLDYKASGKTILFSSHILMDVERLSDSIALIQSGRVQWIGNLDEMNRKVLGFEVICRPQSERSLHHLSIDGDIEQNKKGELRFRIPISAKKALLQRAVENVIQLQSLRPVQEDIEEILFKFPPSGPDKDEK